MKIANDLINNPPEEKIEFVAQTPLGRRLLSLRKKAVAGGMSLLTEEEVLDEVSNRRSGGTLPCRTENEGSDV
ncbi:MAG: hypothetical protein HPY51_17130 [Candidatus Omnitrophica bacterium]|nr:hypothetical protein [Candidatus Omnitrophota bacterium]